jgi:hypothetical protein
VRKRESDSSGEPLKKRNQFLREAALSHIIDLQKPECRSSCAQWDERDGFVSFSVTAIARPA